MKTDISDNAFWISILAIVACTIILLFTIFGKYTYEKDKQIIKLIDRGMPPLEAKCLIRNSTECIIHEAKKQSSNGGVVIVLGRN